MAARWGYFEDSVRLAAALRPALAARGVPEAIYVDNGSAFVDAALKRAAARLGIKITHSAPGRPQGRGKIERFFGIVRQEFLVEIGDGAGITDLAELNRLFTAWYETVYHARPHGETGQPPIQRWLAGAPFPAPSPAQLREAFLWAEYRMVRKDATIKLFGSAYETDPVLAGRRVECVFDPFDLAVVEVRWNGKPYGLARPQPAASQASRARGHRRRIDYLGTSPPSTTAARATAPLDARRPASTTWASSLPSSRLPRQRSRRESRLPGASPCSPAPPRTGGSRRRPRSRPGRQLTQGGCHDRPAQPLRVHPAALRQGPGPVHAAPARRARRGRRPDRLVRRASEPSA